MIPTWFGALVVALGFLTNASRTLRLQMALCVFGATAAVAFPAVGGATASPAVAFLPFLAYRAWSERHGLALRRVPRAGFWLALTVAWGLVSAIAIPRTLDGLVYVLTFDRLGGGEGISPLHPVSGNVTQTAYAIANVITFFSVRTLLLRGGRMDTFARGVLLLSGLNCAAAAFGLAEFYLGVPSLLDALRTANYAIYDAYEVGGLVRVQGTFAETSAFSAFTLPLLAFTSSLWFSRAYSPTAGGLALASLALLLVSTSGTAYVGLATYSTFVALGLVWRLITTGTVPRFRQIAVGVGAGTLVLATVSLFTLRPFLGVIEFFQVTVFTKLNSESGVIRGFANHQAWSAFVNSYGLGVGLGSTRASSFALVLLSNLGALGALLFSAFLANVFLASAGVSPIARAARQAVLAALIAACISQTHFDLGIAFFAFAAAATVRSRDIEEPNACF
jgi:hypothetical protein